MPQYNPAVIVASGSRTGTPLVQTIQNGLLFVGETTVLVFQAARCIVRGRFNLRDVVSQMAAIGVDAIPIIVVTAVSTGGVLAFYTSGVFVRFGAGVFVGGTLALSFLLELGPLLAGIMVAARSGAAISAELGSMVVTEQVDALRSLAVSPVQYLVVPRVLACVLMLPVCGLVSDVAGLGGSILMAAGNGVPPAAYMDSVRTMATETDLLKGLIKTLWFGLTIAAVSCRQGLATSRGAAGVGRSTTSSVVLCVVLIFVSDFFLAQLLMGASVAGR